MYNVNDNAIIAKNSGYGDATQNLNKTDAYSFDYVTIETEEKLAIEVVDCYESLGWKFVKREGTLGLKIALTFKRDRKIKNKEQLNKIQPKIDEALKSINKFEGNKTKSAFCAAIITGVAGTLTLGGGMCLCLLNTAIGAIIGGAVLGALGLGICGLGYLLYRKINIKKSAEMNVLIDKKRDEISRLCEEAQKYLN